MGFATQPATGFQKQKPMGFALDKAKEDAQRSASSDVAVPSPPSQKPSPAMSVGSGSSALEQRILQQVFWMIESQRASFESEISKLREELNALKTTIPKRVAFSGRVSIEGKWLKAEEGEGPEKLIDGVFHDYASDPSKQFVKVNKRTLKASEEIGPLPLDGEADCLWFDKEEHCGDIQV